MTEKVKEKKEGTTGQGKKVTHLCVDLLKRAPVVEVRRAADSNHE